MRKQTNIYILLIIVLTLLVLVQLITPKQVKAEELTFEGEWVIQNGQLVNSDMSWPLYIDYVAPPSAYSYLDFWRIYTTVPELGNYHVKSVYTSKLHVTNKGYVFGTGEYIDSDGNYKWDQENINSATGNGLMLVGVNSAAISGIEDLYNCMFHLKIVLEHCDATPTCENGANCSKCGKYYNALGHNFEDWRNWGLIPNETTYASYVKRNANCTQNSQYWYSCSRCYAANVNGSYFEVPNSALGHNDNNSWAWNTAGGPTCTQGSYKHTTCTRCNAELNKTWVNALGHNDNNSWTWNTAGGPTCTKGSYKHTTCTRCNAELNKTWVNALGHLSNNIWVVGTQPTCTTNGEKHTNCSRCGTTLNGTIIPLLGHIWTYDLSYITTNPTVYTTGVRTFTCQRDHNHISTGIEPKLQFKIFSGSTRIQKIYLGSDLVYNTTTGSSNLVEASGVAQLPQS